MSEPDAHAQLIAEARAYVEHNREWNPVGLSGPAEAMRCALRDRANLTGYLVATLAALDARDAEIARLSASPGADVMLQAELLAERTVKLHGVTYITEIANALQQYGDERAREARAAAIEEAARYHDRLMDEAADREEHAVAQMHSDSADAIRALSPKLGSWT